MEPVEVPANSGQKIPEGVRYGLLQGGEWRLETATLPAEVAQDRGIEIKTADLSAPGEGWAAFELEEKDSPGHGLLLGHLKAGKWQFMPTGNPALDQDGVDAPEQAMVKPETIDARGGEVWLEASVKPAGLQAFPVVAQLTESQSGEALDTARSWCSPTGGTAIEWSSCDNPLGNATIPQAIFEEDGETVAVASTDQHLDVFQHGNGRRP